MIRKIINQIIYKSVVVRLGFFMYKCSCYKLKMESWNNESGFIDFIAYSYNKTFYFYMRKENQY